MIATAIFAKLSADAGVSGLVGSRIYPGTGPDDAAYPLITFAQISTDALGVRPLNGQLKHFRTLYQFDVYAKTELEAEAVAKALRDAIDGVVNQTWGSKAIQASILDDQFDGGFEPAANDFRKILQFRISYQEA